MPHSSHPARYCPIKDYALIGDCHGSALVSRDGSIDWATLHRFDADPVFCRILDADQGGFWSIRPCGEYTITRAYLPGTNILRTVFSTIEGQVAVTDFMPVGRKLNAGVNDYVHLNAPAWIVRRIECLQGTLDLETAYCPSRDFARVRPQLVACDNAVHAGQEMPVLFSDLVFRVEGDLAVAVIRVATGQRHDLVLAGNMVTGEFPCNRVEEFFSGDASILGRVDRLLPLSRAVRGRGPAQCPRP